jgi:hypothetical protein
MQYSAYIQDFNSRKKRNDHELCHLAAHKKVYWKKWSSNGCRRALSTRNHIHEFRRKAETARIQHIDHKFKQISQDRITWQVNDNLWLTHSNWKL